MKRHLNTHSGHPGLRPDHRDRRPRLAAPAKPPLVLELDECIRTALQGRP